MPLGGVLGVNGDEAAPAVVVLWEDDLSPDATSNACASLDSGWLIQLQIGHSLDYKQPTREKYFRPA